MSADGDIVRAERLYVYWCPRCERQSERACHFCKKGPPLIPQLDEETQCERLEVVALARLEAAEHGRDLARLDTENEQRLLRQAVAQRDTLAEALRTICDIGETRDVEVARAALAEAGLE